MDLSLQPATPNALPMMPATSRKRSRENESPSQRHKREKAAERQRRKRERDRMLSTNNTMAIPQTPQQQHHHHPPPPPTPQQQLQQLQQQAQLSPHVQPAPPGDDYNSTELTGDEAARRDRVRAAARDRQRKHRLLVKQKKMRDLGVDMGNDVLPSMEDVQYRVTAEGQFAVLQHDLNHAANQMGQPEPPFPQGPLGGQTFASTLLLSFSCAPLLKQHLLRTLQMTNEELASLEPIIAQAWDQWDYQRHMHRAQQAQVAGVVNKPPDGHNIGEASSSPYGSVDMTDHNAGQYPVDPSQQPQPNDFRARFHRPLVAPSPFRTFPPPQAANSTSSSSASAPGSDPIDPHLGVGVGDHVQQAEIDPELGQARGEAEGVVGRLERG